MLERSGKYLVRRGTSRGVCAQGRCLGFLGSGHRLRFSGQNGCLRSLTKLIFDSSPCPALAGGLWMTCTVSSSSAFLKILTINDERHCTRSDVTDIASGKMTFSNSSDERCSSVILPDVSGTSTLRLCASSEFNSSDERCSSVTLLDVSGTSSSRLGASSEFNSSEESASASAVYLSDQEGIGDDVF